MATTNKGLEQPALNSTNWNTPLNANFGYIDEAMGGVTTKSVTGVGTTPVVLTEAEYRKLILNFTGVLTANVTYRIPSGVGGEWIVSNGTTGSFTLTIGNAGGGASITIPAGGRRTIYSDGTNIYSADNSVEAIGSSGTVIYNSGGNLTGSSAFTYDGSKVTVTVTTATTNAAVEGLRIDAQSSGTPSIGFGPMIAMAAETAPSVTKVGGQIVAEIADASTGSEDFDLVFSLMSAGAAAAEQVRVKSTGVVIPRVALWATDVFGKTGGNDAKINGAVPLNATTLRTELNASGSAPLYACRAWVNFNGTGTPAILASGNVTSITDNGGAGDYTIAFTTAMQDVNYVILATVDGPAGATGRYFVTYGTKAVGGFRLTIKNSSGTQVNNENISVAIFR